MNSRIVLNQIITKVVLSAIDYYEKISANQELRQKLSIQILFDVKYVTLLMIPRENKILSEKSTAVCNNIVAKIDPFDLDVFYPFIHTNVKKAVQRTLVSGRRKTLVKYNPKFQKEIYKIRQNQCHPGKNDLYEISTNFVVKSDQI